MSGFLLNGTPGLELRTSEHLDAGVAEDRIAGINIQAEFAEVILSGEAGIGLRRTKVIQVLSSPTRAEKLRAAYFDLQDLWYP